MNLAKDYILQAEISAVEASVNGAVLAFGVGHLIKLHVDDPVLNVAAASKSHDNGIARGRVPCKALDIACTVREGLGAD